MINNDHIPLKCIKMQQSQVCKEQKIELKNQMIIIFYLWMITYFWIEKQFR